MFSRYRERTEYVQGAKSFYYRGLQKKVKKFSQIDVRMYVLFVCSIAHHPTCASERRKLMLLLLLSWGYVYFITHLFFGGGTRPPNTHKTTINLSFLTALLAIWKIYR